MGVATYAAEVAAIMGRLNTNWGSTTPVAWPNKEYTPTDVAYIEPKVRTQEAFNRDIGASSRSIRHPGMLTVVVRVPLNTGEQAATAHADTIAGYFRNVTFSGITFRAPTVRDFGPDGPWYRVEVTCPYWRDSIH